MKCLVRSGLLGAWLVPFTAAAQVRRPELDTTVRDQLRHIVTGVVRAWDTAHIVCLGEAHGSKNDSDLRMALMQHPEFAQRVNVILIEFANTAHQALIDRLVLEGEHVSRRELSIVWKSTSGAEVWASPVYEQFLREVGRLNQALPQTRRLRVIAADKNVPNRGQSFRDIAAELLDRKLKVLAVFGSRHCERRGGGFPGELEGRYPGRFWSASTVYGHDAVHEARRMFRLGTEPHLVPITGSPYADMPALKLFFSGRHDDAARLADIVDAIIYYGDIKDEIVGPPSN